MHRVTQTYGPALNKSLHQTPQAEHPRATTRLTRDERELLRQEALERFFPETEFVAGSGDGGLKLAHGGAMAVAICTERLSRPNFHFGLKVSQFAKIAEAELAYLVLCGVLRDETMTERERVFFRVPLRIIDECPYIMGDRPLTSVSLWEGERSHYNLHLRKRRGEWILSIGGGDPVSLAGCDQPLGTVFVPAHLRSAPSDLSALALPTTIAGLRDCQQYAALVSANDPTVEIVCTLRRKT